MTTVDFEVDYDESKIWRTNYPKFLYKYGGCGGLAFMELREDTTTALERISKLLLEHTKADSLKDVFQLVVEVTHKQGSRDLAFVCSQNYNGRNDLNELKEETIEEIRAVCSCMARLRDYHQCCNGDFHPSRSTDWYRLVQVVRIGTLFNEYYPETTGLREILKEQGLLPVK